jgi:hypothetical protein
MCLRLTLLSVSVCVLPSVVQPTHPHAPQEPRISDLSSETRRLQTEMCVNDISVESLLVQQHVQVASHDLAVFHDGWPRTCVGA